MKLLASRNILIGVTIIAFVAIAIVVLQQTSSGSTDTTPTAERIGAPPAASGDAVPLDTVLTALHRSGTAGIRRYRSSPLTGHVDAVRPVHHNGWAAAVTLDGGRATAYFADAPWQAAAPAVTAGQTRLFTCADWRTGPSITMYGCGFVGQP
jgi:hypothetical protein